MSKRQFFVPLIWPLLFILWSLPALAQDTLLWSRTYGGSGDDYCQSVRQTTDGGYIVTGSTESFGAGSDDVYLIKIDSTGDTLWSRTYGDGSIEGGQSVQQTADRGYILAGFLFWLTPYNDQWVYLIKTDSLGNTLWTRKYGGESGSSLAEAKSVEQTADGGYIVTGSSFNDVCLIKTDPLGNILWTRTYGGSMGDYARSVQQTTDGGYIVAATTRSYGAGGNDVYLIKTDSTGDTLWTRTYGGSSCDYARSVQQTTDGGYIVAGQTESFGAGDYDVFLIKTDSTGGTLWSRTYGGSGVDEGRSVEQTTDGGYVVTGWTESFGISYLDVCVIKTDSLGNTLWSRTYGGSSDDYAYSVQQTTDGGYMVAGWTESYGGGNRDMMLTKLDSLGNTCIGEFVSPTVMSVSPTVTSPATQVSSSALIVTSPPDTVTSPPTEVTAVCVAIRGDANGDEVVDVADVVYLVNFLYRGGDPPVPIEAGDANCDGIVNVADVVYLVNYLYRGGDPPGCP
jgi:hypothetical protein